MPEVLIARRTAPIALITFITLAIAVLLSAGSARAASPITNFFAGPIAASANCSPEGTAGAALAASRTDFCVAYRTKNDPPANDDLKSQVIDTPTGFSGEPDRFPQCTDAQFNKASDSNAACPPASQMGSVQAEIRVDTGNPLLGTQSLAPGGVVYNLEHGPNEVARLGIDLRPTFVVDQPNVKIIVRVTLRPSPDVGLRSIIDDLPKTADVDQTVLLGGIARDRPLAVDSFALRFWGAKADHPSMPRDFGMLGSDCSVDQQTHVAALSYDGTPTSADATPYRLTGCDSVPFAPSAQYSTAENRPDVTTETYVKVNFGEFGNPRTSAAVKKTVVVLPTGLSFSGQIASGANGLPLCTEAQFAHFSNEHSTCPDATAVGSVQFKSPLLSRVFTGQAFLGPQPSPGALPDLFIEAEQGPAADAPRVKLVGKLTIDDQNRIVTTIDDLPQVLVDQFFLTFRGGDQAAVVTPPTCGDYKGALAAYSYSAPNTPVSSEQTYSVNADCDSAGSFSPAVAFSSTNPVAGASAPFAATVTRPDRSQRLAKTVIDLPAGELATLKGVPECSQAAAAQNACPADTKVGTITSLAGVGPAPYTANGTVYLTARSDGAVAGLSLSVPIRFGEVDLGTLAVPARIEIRPGDLGLRFIADVPERFAGVPLNIRSIGVTLDRKGFPLNPTNCGVLSTTSSITGTGGTVASVPANFQVNGCAALPFAPVIEAAATGSTGNLGRPNVSVRISSPDGSSALRQTYVTLPKGIGVDLTQIPRACAIDEFAAGGCPDTAIIGAVSGSLSITDEPLSGDLYLLKAAPGKTLPGLGLAFKGRFSGRVVGANQIDTKTGQLVTAFDALPDLPLTSFQIDIKGGTGGPVISTKELCASTVDFVAKFVAHSGPTVNRTATTQCGVPLGTSLTKISARLGGVRKGKPTLVLTANAPAGKKVKQLDVTLPKGYTLSSSKAKSRKAIVLKQLTTKGKVTSKRVGSKLRIVLPKAGTTKVRLITRTGAMSIKSKSLRKSKTRVVVIFTATYTDGSKGSVPVRLTPH